MRMSIGIKYITTGSNVEDIVVITFVTLINSFIVTFLTVRISKTTCKKCYISGIGVFVIRHY